MLNKNYRSQLMITEQPGSWT